MEQKNDLTKISKILNTAGEAHATDIHFAPGSPLMFRVDGELKPQTGEIMTPEETREIMDSLLDEEQKEQLMESGELDFAYSIPGFSRIRVNVYKQRGTYALALRLLAFKVPTPEELKIPEAVLKLTEKKSGLIIIAGAAGSGKTTTMAALVEVIAQKYTKNIITIEDPIEYLHTRTKSLVSQREIGYDTLSYANALHAAMRQDPDVIEVGELNDVDTIQTALAASAAGHLVISSLPTKGTLETIDRIIEVFPPHKQQLMRLQLADVLSGIIIQQLLPRVDAEGRVRAYEVLLGDKEVQKMIRENKISQIPAYMRESGDRGMQLMDDAVISLYMKSMISARTAVKYSHDPSAMEQKVDLE